MTHPRTGWYGRGGTAQIGSTGTCGIRQDLAFLSAFVQQKLDEGPVRTCHGSKFNQELDRRF